MMSLAGFFFFYRFIVFVRLKSMKIICSKMKLFFKVSFLYYLSKKKQVARITQHIWDTCAINLPKGND